MKTTERLLAAVREIWAGYSEHPFVLGLQNGDLPRECFRYYIIQDALYLRDYARVFALGVAKSRSLEVANLFAKYIAVMNGELNIHEGYLGQLGVTRQEMDEARPSQDNLSYTSYMLRVAYEESEVEILAAILACAYSYEMIAREMVARRPDAVNHEFYGDWVRGYASDDYAAGNVELLAMLDKLTAHYTEKELAHLEEIFVVCSRYEMMFWQMAWEIKQ